MTANTSTFAADQLTSLFGSYKAEWLKDRVFELFTEPSYLPELTKPRPCILVGGRGTGKTTVLRAMSYQGQFVRNHLNPDEINKWKYFGLYYRVNTNRVAVFAGPELTREKWIKLFAHYLNLIICERLVEFLKWYSSLFPLAASISSQNIKTIATSLHLASCLEIDELFSAISESLNIFESHINNVADGESLPLSLQGAAIDLLFQYATELPQFRNKSFFLLIDEYENFSDDQQQVVNTLIKHAVQHYTFKIGVRELGWRCRTTLNPTEQLISPSDYVRIDISEKLDKEKFSQFALNVCNERIKHVKLPSGKILGIESLLPGLSLEEEAEILDREGSQLAAKAKSEIITSVHAPFKKQAAELSILECYFIKTWEDEQLHDLRSKAEDYLENRAAWETRYQNYAFSLLFSLKNKKAGIRKFYCGWETYTRLAAGNIRYFLELVEQALLLHIGEDQSLANPISPKLQTIAAQNVGRKNLTELEGLSVHGALLTKLLLGLGRIFQRMASDPIGHAPEVTQFHLSDVAPGQSSNHLNEDWKAAVELLNAAVMHLALLRFSGSKLADAGDTKDYDYSVHPIFSAFFGFSHRRKRKLLISSHDLVTLTRSPKPTITRLLGASFRVAGDNELPDQLQLFKAYYEGT